MTTVDSLTDDLGGQRAAAPVEPAAPTGRVRRVRAWLRTFRRTRPFWGGLYLAFGGWIIMSLTFAPLSVTLAAGVGGISGYLLGGGMMVFAFFAWFVPSQRHLAGLLGIAFALAAFVLSNLGGFVVGMLLGVVGGGMVFSWGPAPQRRPLARLLGRERPAAVGEVAR